MVDKGCEPSPSLTLANNSLDYKSRYSFSKNNNFKLVPTPLSSLDEILPCKTKVKEEVTTTSNTKRPKGRPFGSKNKPKPPILIKQDSDPLLKPIIIEIPIGNDVIETLIKLSHHRCVGISVLSGLGCVSNVTLRHPMSHLRGHFNILSLTGTYMSGCFPPLSSFSIHLLDNQSQVFGGVVGGKVVAASLVVVTIFMFKKFEYYRVPFMNISVEEIEEDEPGVIYVDAREPNGITHNNITMSAFGVATNSILHNCELPPRQRKTLL